MLLQPLPPAIIGGRVLELKPLPGDGNGHAGRVQLGIHAQIQGPSWRRGAGLVLARDPVVRLPRHADDLRTLALNTLQGGDGRLQVVNGHVLALGVDHLRNTPRQRDHARDLEEVASVAGQLHGAARSLAAEHIFGDKEHAVQLSRHGRPCLSLVIEYGRLQDRGAEAQELVVGVCRGGVATLRRAGLIEDGLVRPARLIGEGVFKGGGEGIGDLVGGCERNRGEAVRGVVSAEKGGGQSERTLFRPRWPAPVQLSRRGGTRTINPRARNSCRDRKPPCRDGRQGGGPRPERSVARGRAVRRSCRGGG